MVSRLLIVTTLIMAVPPTAVAHHSFAAFNFDKSIVIEGTVADYRLQNPHAHITLQVRMVEGKPQPKPILWDVEGAAANIMRRQGWSGRSLKPGDQVTFVGNPLRSGDPGLSLSYVILPDGSRLFRDISRPAAGSKRP